MSAESWSERLFGGFRKTSERLTENLAGIVTQRRSSTTPSSTTSRTR